MDTSLATRLRKLLELALPFGVALFCVVLSMLPYGFTTGIIVVPVFALMAIFYWALYRPDLMPPFAVFLVGFYQDLLSSGPLGLWAFVYLLVYGIVLSQRLFFIGKSSLAIWLGFGVVTVLSGFALWGIGCLYFTAVLSPWPVFLQAAMTFALYPIFSKIFSGIQRRLIEMA